MADTDYSSNPAPLQPVVGGSHVGDATHHRDRAHVSQRRFFPWPTPLRLAAVSAGVVRVLCHAIDAKRSKTALQSREGRHACAALRELAWQHPDTVSVCSEKL